MGLFTTVRFNDLRDLLLDQLKDLYDAELRLTEALPRMAEAAQATELKSAFESHLQETEHHVQRIEQVFHMIGEEPERQTCDAMKGLLKEGEHVLDAEGDMSVRDAALIAAAQRVEHYEIAGYGSARAFAQRLGLESVAALLQQTLNEEGNADKLLTRIAESSVNVQASQR